MEYCFLKGLLLVLLLQNCTSEGPPSSIQSSTGVTLQGDQTLPREAEVLPVVAPPSLKEVQQAVQEASEQVEGRGAEEVLKELLERVVGAALGQVEGGSEAKADEGVVQETVEEDALGAEGGPAEGNTEVNVSEQEVEKEELEGEDMGIKGGDTGAEEEPELSEVDALEDGAEEGEAFAEGEGETAAGSVVETAGGVKIGGREAYGVEVISESLDIQVSQEVAGGTVTVSGETGGDPRVAKPGMWDNNEQHEVALSEEKGAAEIEAPEAEETPAAVEVAVGREPELDKVGESDHGVAAADGEQTTDVWGKENAGEAEIQVDKLDGEATALPSDHFETETKQPVAAEAREEEEEEVNRVKDAEGAKVGDQQGHFAVEGGANGTNGSERDAEGKMKEELVASVNEEGEQQAGEEEQIALETSFGSEREDQETLLISAPVPEDGAEASLQQSPERQTPTMRPSLAGVEKGENTLVDEISIHGNEIITPTDDLLPQSPDMAKPTLDNVLKDALAEPPQAEREEPGEANGLAEDTETNELGLEAWKIGAISAAIFLALETAVILIYILKCHNKKSTLALQRTCEEGCVEAEATTGGDCSDDTLPASNGDAQQIAEFDPSDVASTLAINKEQHKAAHAIPMSDLPPGTTEESANTGPGPDSHDLRTSIL